MDLQRTFLIIGLAIIGYVLILQWNQDYHQSPNTSTALTVEKSTASNISIQPNTLANDGDIPSITSNVNLPDTTHIQTSENELISIKTDVINALIDPVGGDIVYIDLPKYPSSKNTPDSPLILLEKKSSRYFVAQSGLLGTDGTDKPDHERPRFKTTQDAFYLSENEQQLTVNLLTKTKKALITKQFTFTRGSYQVKIDYIIKNISSTPWKGNFYAQLKRDNSPDPSKENNASGGVIRAYLGAAVKSKDKLYDKKPFGDFSATPFNQTVIGGYAAILQHYFVSAWIPPQTQSNLISVRETQNQQGQKFNIVGFTQELGLTIQPGETGKTGATLYAGPKKQAELAELAEGLDLTVDYGILWWFAKPLFILLQLFHSLFNNWGWSIIALTVLVKTIFYPLSAASYRSMARMRILTPKMQELKAQYGDDRQKMSTEMMALYKKEKVNPMGGCLPIVVQMPVFISLYWVLAESVELRHAPWMGWIQDLSQMDPYFILPLLMGGSMFVQQMLSPMSPDPVQARVMKLMPIIFTFFFLWFPSGLVLYWVVNNLLSILQQWSITRKIESPKGKTSIINIEAGK